MKKINLTENIEIGRKENKMLLIPRIEIVKRIAESEGMEIIDEIYVDDNSQNKVELHFKRDVVHTDVCFIINLNIRDGIFYNVSEAILSPSGGLGYQHVYISEMKKWSNFIERTYAYLRTLSEHRQGNTTVCMWSPDTEIVWSNKEFDEMRVGDPVNFDNLPTFGEQFRFTKVPNDNCGYIRISDGTVYYDFALDELPQFTGLEKGGE